jgi:hypothetical protein
MDWIHLHMLRLLSVHTNTPFVNCEVAAMSMSVNDEYLGVKNVSIDSQRIVTKACFAQEFVVHFAVKELSC